ncbi:MAG: hypothetical protein Fur0023_21760 [Bacteroidia bacterium]
MEDATNKNICTRTNYKDMGNNYFNNYHEFGGIWTDYKIVFQVDGSNKGIATKFSNTGMLGQLFCDNLKPIYSPKQCINMATEPECLNWGPFGLWCNQWNWAFKDVYFPFRPLQTIIQNRINIHNAPNGCPQSALDAALNNWNSFTDEQRQTKIDYLIIYQPVKCYTDFQVLNEPHFKSITGGTNFLSGRKLTISNGAGSNLYINESPKPSNNWHEFPTHILATDEIVFLNDVAFEEGTFLRAEIIDCNTGISGVSQRINPTNNNTDLPPVLPIDYFDQQDTLTKQLFPDKPSISQTDNGAIQIHPNPTNSHLHISMPEEDWNDLTHIYLITPLGAKTELPKSEIQDFSHLSNGLYFLQFHFSNGMIVVKNVVKVE